jgi:alkylation response protein AidB-like acyl-CoA dehydrogenase
LLGAKGVADEGADPIPPVHVFVPKCDIEVDDTWYTLGMRATGSKDIVASDVFVPEYRSLLTGRMFNGTFEGDTGPLYRLPVVGGLSSMLAGTVVGMTERGIEAFIDVTKVREDIYAGGGKAEKVGIQMRVAEAQGEIELASMLVDRNCQLLDDAMAKNEPPMSVPDQTQLQWNASYAVELCRRATERVFAVAGAHVVYDTSELQRLFRDVNTACHHAIIDFDGIREARGKLALGVR